MQKRDMLKLMSLYPPYLGAGVHVKNIAEDFRSIDVELKMHFWNKNYVGTHFGGSLYSMTDPFYMLLLVENLGRNYIVWDKAASITFKKPGVGTLTAHFNLTQEQIADIKAKADTDYKVEPEFDVQITDEAGDVVAEVHKILYVRHKDHQPRAPGPEPG
jgi:hypothetical protein